MSFDQFIPPKTAGNRWISLCPLNLCAKNFARRFMASIRVQMLEVFPPHEARDSAQSFGGQGDWKFLGPLCPPSLCAPLFPRWFMVGAQVRQELGDGIDEDHPAWPDRHDGPAFFFAGFMTPALSATSSVRGSRRSRVSHPDRHRAWRGRDERRAAGRPPVRHRRS